jgi:leucine dehydrogenase
MMESLIQEWDGEAVIVRHDRPTGAWTFIAIHSTLLGPATGGTRMKSYSDQEAALEDALRLAAGMTYKFAVPDIERGGGKAVINIPKSLDPDSRTDLLRRHGKLVHQLGGLFYTGPDVGTSSADMDTIAEAGSPYVFCRTPEAGGAGSPGPFTARGVFSGIKVACEHVFGETSLKRRKVLVQGVGSVGGILVELLGKAGAEVLFSEVDDQLIQHFRDEQGVQFIPLEDVYKTECDIFAPCALGGVINERTIRQLKCRVIAGAANNQLADPEDGGRLRAKGILYAPDYVINVGGAMASPGIETLGWSHSHAEEGVANSVRSALERIFEMADSADISTNEAARRIAEEHLSKSAKPDSTRPTTS